MSYFSLSLSLSVGLKVVVAGRGSKSNNDPKQL